MDFIQNWNNPQFAYLLIPLMIGMMTYAYLLMWSDLRGHRIAKTLDPNTKPVSFIPVILQLIGANILELGIVIFLISMLPNTALIWGFIYTFIIAVILVWGQITFSGHLLRKYGFLHSEIEENLSNIKRVPYIGHRYIRPMLFILAMALLILALMEPQGDEQTTRLRRTPMQTTIAFDLSRSMNANDLAPTRLAAARDEITTLLESSHGDELGLVFFTDSAIVQSPQTYDTAWLTTLLNTTKPEDMPTRGTDINNALKTAMSTFSFSANNRKPSKDDHSQRILLVTDGENHSGDLDSTIQELNRRHIHVDVMAVGTENGAEITNDDGTTLTYKGAPVVSRLKTETLQKISEQTDGIFTRLTTPTIASRILLTAWDTIRIDIAPHKISASYYRTPLYRYFLYPAYLLLVIYLIYPVFSWKLNRWLRRRQHKKNIQNADNDTVRSQVKREQS